MTEAEAKGLPAQVLFLCGAAVKCPDCKKWHGVEVDYRRDDTGSVLLMGGEAVYVYTNERSSEELHRLAVAAREKFSRDVVVSISQEGR